MDLLPFLKYAEYFLFSKHRRGHGIHSPFVFDIVSGTFRNKIDPDIVSCIESIRSKMISDQETIVVNDLGAGSVKMKSSLRKVTDIARYSAVPRKYGILLSNMSKTFAGPMVLEFGTSLGISTMYMAASSPETKVYTMEGCKAASEIAFNNFREAGLSNIRMFNGPFEEVLPEIRREKITPGLVFIDGNHRKEPVMSYFNQVAEMSDFKTVVIIDDINTTRGMGEAWSEIRNHNKVTFTIDICRMGIAFFREGINHLNYVIRY